MKYRLSITKACIRLENSAGNLVPYRRPSAALFCEVWSLEALQAEEKICCQNVTAMGTQRDRAKSAGQDKQKFWQHAA